MNWIRSAFIYLLGGEKERECVRVCARAHDELTLQHPRQTTTRSSNWESGGHFMHLYTLEVTINVSSRKEDNLRFDTDKLKQE